jgi:hypothetical protein
MSPTTPSGPFSPTGTPSVSSIAPSTPPSTGVLDSVAQTGSELTGHTITGDQIETGLTGLAGVAGTEYAGKSIIDAQEAADKAAKEDEERGLAFAKQGSSGLAALKAAGLSGGTGPLGGLGGIGMATGGITALAHGGQIPLGDGAYIIPADVVSALGNGSSKAGAEYLRQLMVAVRKEAVGRQGMGAAKKHVA